MNPPSSSGISVIVTTYNSPATLRWVLIALRRQSLLPAEVIVADDGSGDDTARVLREAAPQLPFRLRHVWQPDEGFRAARSRNNAIHLARHPVLAFLDQDVLPHGGWLETHAAHAAPRRLCLGHVLDLSASCASALTDSTVASGAFESLHTDADFARLHRLHRKFTRHALLRIFGLAKRNKPKLRSCNFAAARPDLVEVNGFDEAYVGWGQEDDDLGRRLYSAGVRPVILLDQARVSHIAHPERHDADWRTGPNVARYQAAGPAARCRLGLDSHPHPDVTIRLEHPPC